MTRPDPEVPLKRVQEEDDRSRRARFKVFFGAAPGVGKTYAMLQEAQRMKWEGLDVVVGLVETHGRAETRALLAGLEGLPPREVRYRGVVIQEFDLEAALKRKPALVLVDELAHTNSPGCRHAKRWQDVMELLTAGIDVYSTVNVQHLESLKEVVAQITGVVVQERIPDTVLERCDEMELVDISVEELTQRLSEGKVYVPDQARHAIQRFFRKGNLLALRELALRRTADLVDADMQRYREEKGIQDTWAAAQRLMVAITPKAQSEILIRETCRMANSLGASWLAVYVDYGSRLTDEDRDRLESHLRLVERLGGEGIALPGHGTLAEDLLLMAKKRNVTQIMLGRTGRPQWLDRFKSGVLYNLSEQAGRIHVHLIPLEHEKKTFQFPTPAPSPWPGMATLLLCALQVGLATTLSLLLFSKVELADIAMIFTIPILVTAIRYGRNAALATSALAVLSFDFFFIPPRFTFTVGDARHLGTFAIMLGMGFVIGNLTERVRQSAFRAQNREQRTLALYRFGNVLVGSDSQADTINAAIRAVESQFQTQVAFYMPDGLGRLQPAGQTVSLFLEGSVQSVAQWAFDHNEPAGQGTTVLPASKALFLPLKGAKGVLGVMGLKTEDGPFWREADQRHVLESFANQAALALERALLSAETQAIRLKAEQEEVRSTVLSSVSHDLRTPLAGIIGSATTLLEDPGVLEEDERSNLLMAIQEEAFRMHRLVSNLLDLTKLESGAISLKKEWLPAEELLGVLMNRLGRQAENRDVQFQVSPPGAMLCGDPVLLEQLLINLADNALKFTKADQSIEIQVHQTGKGATILVNDKGAGIPEGFEERIFDKLFRLPGSEGGAGLGLAICHGIVQLHHGSIQAHNRPEGGAQFVVHLPFDEDQPPALEADL